MKYDLLKEMIDLLAVYEDESEHSGNDVFIFLQWMNERLIANNKYSVDEPDWKGKSNGRSADSVINTTLVHVYRYAKLAAKAALNDSAISTPDDFFYLITLSSYGSMSKTALIKANVHDKSTGVQIINRLITNGFAGQQLAEDDKRSRIIYITDKGLNLLNAHMPSIKLASSHVTEALSLTEKMELMRLLNKLEDFHKSKLDK